VSFFHLPRSHRALGAKALGVQGSEVLEVEECQMGVLAPAELWKGILAGAVWAVLAVVEEP